MSAKARINIDLGLVNSNNIGTFKKLNETVLPTKYPNDFYDLTKTGTIQRMAYFNEIPVGCIKAKLEFHPNNDKLPQLVYIDSIAVLEPYRSFGIGSKLLEYIQEETVKRYIHLISIHVQKQDQRLIDWYKKNGFEVVTEVKDYYKDHNLSDNDAVYMTKSV